MQALMKENKIETLEQLDKVLIKEIERLKKGGLSWMFNLQQIINSHA